MKIKMFQIRDIKRLFSQVKLNETMNMEMFNLHEKSKKLIVKRMFENVYKLFKFI